MKKVLVVDDTKNIRNLLTTCLELRGFETRTAKNGVEAMEILSTETFDLIFLDVKMPELSGTEVLKRIREMGCTCTVVMMTAYATVKNAIECTRLSAVAYLQKPFTIDKINDLLDMIYNPESTDSTLEKLLSQARDLLDQDRVTDAYNLLKRCLSIDPSDSETYQLLSKVFEKRNEPEEAEHFRMTATLFLKNK